jgi:hypothetical protein
MEIALVSKFLCRISSCIALALIATSVTATDWLIDDAPFVAEVIENADKHEVALSNGLIKRTFRISPNAATVGFDNLVTGESILRGVKPEALVEIDGESYEVGGLKGQPNYAFLRHEWIDALTANPEAFQFVGYEVGAPKERMAWKRVRHRAPDSVWPPKGVHLRMDYRMPAPGAGASANGLVASNLGRKALIVDNFEAMGADWKVRTSTAHPRSSFINEGKTGEIYTLANTHVYAERDLPAGTRLVEATIHPGTDRSSSWGPGIALVWPGKTIKFNMRPGEPGFGGWDGSKELHGLDATPPMNVEKAWSLRMRLGDNTIFCEARSEGGRWQTITTIPIPEGLGAPKSARVGKMDLRGKRSDHGATGSLVRLKVERFAAYGEVDQAKVEAAKAPPEKARDISVSVHYELYDGIPAMSKWITVDNKSTTPLTVNGYTSEILAAVEFGSAVEKREYSVPKPNIHVETDYAFASFNADDANHHAVRWEPDPEYKSQVNWLRLTPCLLKVGPEVGPEQEVAPGASFESFRTFVMPYDSYDRDRKGLALRRMYRTLAPWITENPLMMHARFADWERVKRAIDQSAEAGFEMVILTFGSGFNIEDESDEYLAKMKGYADYAREKGVEIGGYSLLASRRINKENDVVMPEGQSPTFGNSPCLESEWGQDYFRKLYQFYEKTGFRLLEHDGSYPGDVCMSTEHPGHKGLADSRWNQYQRIDQFYRWCRSQGLYLNVPDYYYLTGSNKCGMGYREVNWSLPRAEQVMHTRQNIYDGAWEKTGSMGWMFVPLTEYHGGGAAATIEPLDEHLGHYERMMMSNLALGVQACYRGPRLFDTERTKAMVQRSVAWYKKYRDILESDMVHGRRADGRDVDWMLHVNPRLKHKGMLVVFNPLAETVTRTLKPNLYYTGLTDSASIRQEEGAPKAYTLNRDYTVEIDVTVPAEGFTWLVIE